MGNGNFTGINCSSFKDFESGSVAAPINVDVPNVWNNYHIEGKGLPGFGYATYRLKVVGWKAGEPLAVRIDNMSTLLPVVYK